MFRFRLRGRCVRSTALWILAIWQACGAQGRAATEIKPPENFGDVFINVFRASENAFSSIKGAPVSGPNSFKRDNGETTQRFRWIPTLVLPGSKKDSCVILQEETTSINGNIHTFPAKYACELIYDGAQVLPVIQTALGPAWSIDSKTYHGDVVSKQVFFCQTATEKYPPVTLIYMKTGHSEVVISSSLGSR